ncbi:hypothetical protein ACF052_33060 [Streptomyces pilosus]|uniref:hypothetical protein n=1 Tax=Streptomyces pilosus TaxID=28893 RepID=UPI0036FF7867
MSLTGRTVHAITLHRRLAASRRDPLTGLLRRHPYTAPARQTLRRHGDSTAVVMVDAAALQKLTDGRIAAFDSEKRTYTLLDDTSRLAVQAEVRVSGRVSEGGTGSAFHRGRLTSIPGRRRYPAAS